MLTSALAAGASRLRWPDEETEAPKGSMKCSRSSQSTLGLKEWGLPGLEFPNAPLVPHLAGKLLSGSKGPGEAGRLVSKPHTPAPGVQTP